MNKITRATVCIVLVLISLKGLTQEKFERESRIAKSDLPAFTEGFESIFTGKQRIRWYLEEGLERNSVEAKYKRNGKHFSVEFDTLGTMEDVEIRTKLSDLPETAQKNIVYELEKHSDKYSIDKVQIQYSGNKQDLEQVSVSGECDAGCTVRYELVVRIKRDKQLSSFEYLFDEQGMLVKRSKILIQMSSNLEY